MPRLETYENYISEHLLYLPPINLCKYYPCHSTLLQFYLFRKLQKYFLFDVPIICHFLASWCFVFVRINTRHVKKKTSESVQSVMATLYPLSVVVIQQ